MRKVRGSTLLATLAPHSASYAGVAAFSTFQPAPRPNSLHSKHVSAVAFHHNFHVRVGNPRSFHTTAPASKKKKNKWNAAKRYLAKMEEWEAEQNGEVSGDAAAREMPQERKVVDNVIDEKEEISRVVDEGQEVSDEELYQDLPDSVVRSQTLDWIKQVVIGLNLCPFAASPLASNKLSIETIRGHDAESIAAAVLLELILRVDNPGTTVVVAPECSPDDFETYLQVLNFIEAIMEEHKLVGKVQVAPFHPLFEFGGRSDDDDGAGGDGKGIDNYTNRSPFPMFHVLREEEVGAAVDKLDGDASVVFDRNIRLMNMLYDKLGREGVEKVMSCKASEDMKKAVEEVLKAVKKTNDINVS